MYTFSFLVENGRNHDFGEKNGITSARS